MSVERAALEGDMLEPAGHSDGIAGAHRQLSAKMAAFPILLAGDGQEVAASGEQNRGYRRPWWKRHVRNANDRGVELAAPVVRCIEIAEHPEMLVDERVVTGVHVDRLFRAVVPRVEQA